MKELSQADIYRELEADPDLRRLGEYKIVPNEGKPITPIDVNLEGRDIHLGEGDFTDTFVAFSHTKAGSLDFGNSTFTEIYLDNMEVDVLRFSDSKTSRVFFDSAHINTCEFNNFISPEVYFDSGKIGTIAMQNLRSSILYLSQVEVGTVNECLGQEREYRFAVDKGGTNNFGNFNIAREQLEDVQAESDQKILFLTPDEFIGELKKDPDLSRLGKYAVSQSDATKSLQIDLELTDQDINFGEGDLSLLPVSFGHTTAKNINFSRSKFAHLNLGELVTKRLDFSHSQVGWLHFDSAKIGECFFSDFSGFHIFGGTAEISHIFGERGAVEDVHLESMVAEQLHCNHLQAKEFHLGQSIIKELSLSAGKGIKKMFCENGQVWLLNLHEAELEELHFENSHMTKALIGRYPKIKTPFLSLLMIPQVDIVAQTQKVVA